MTLGNANNILLSLITERQRQKEAKDEKEDQETFRAWHTAVYLPAAVFLSPKGGYMTIK
jgi:hypothetical protein